MKNRERYFSVGDINTIRNMNPESVFEEIEELRCDLESESDPEKREQIQSLIAQLEENLDSRF